LGTGGKTNKQRIARTLAARIEICTAARFSGPKFALTLIGNVMNGHSCRYPSDRVSCEYGFRGSTYDQAMQAFPDARCDEFLQIIEADELEVGMRVLDVPAGGGYLRRCRTRQRSAAFPMESRTLDAVVSWAGVHHIEDKSAFLAECSGVLKPGGVSALSDVAESSETAQFLDGFVGRHNSTGHWGHYVSGATGHLLDKLGFAIEAYRIERFHWRFGSLGDVGAFCRDLFELIQASLDEIIGASAEELGIDILTGGISAIRRSLLKIRARKR